MSLENEIAFVSGASRGIGKEIALSLGAEGATVVGTATSESGAENISNYLKENDIKGKGLVMNVTDQDSITDTVKAITEDFGTPTILINNAGITRDNLVMRMKDAEWDDIMNTNLSSIFRVSKACLRGMMKAKKGRIISIASVVGVTGNAGQANYAAAKAGVIGFSKSLAREVGSRGITVNVVAPGFIDTDMTRALPEAQRDALLGQISLGRLGDAAEIAHAVTFLASPGAGYITGETIHVNGGMYMS
ncbi:MAG: 3-oxoacyl-ACP reductase FabG [Gammaproteobacteria bacterium]|nr:MAG: 3-oxoacyl-ACP reductase FabG [Gammaproteobacteria bacterium]